MKTAYSLAQAVSQNGGAARENIVTSDGISKFPHIKYRHNAHEAVKALTDTFVKNVKPARVAGDKHADGDGMYLLVTPAGKYWRLDYRFLGKRNTLALGVYPDTSLAKARIRRAEARTLLADGIDPGQAKRETKLARIAAASETFEMVARTWLEKTSALRAATTQEKVTG